MSRIMKTVAASTVLVLLFTGATTAQSAFASDKSDVSQSVESKAYSDSEDTNKTVPSSPKFAKLSDDEYELAIDTVTGFVDAIAEPKVDEVSKWTIAWSYLSESSKKRIGGFHNFLEHRKQIEKKSNQIHNSAIDIAQESRESATWKAVAIANRVNMSLIDAPGVSEDRLPLSLDLVRVDPRTTPNATPFAIDLSL